MTPGASFELRYYVAIQVKLVSQQFRPMQVFSKLQSLGTSRGRRSFVVHIRQGAQWMGFGEMHLCSQSREWDFYMTEMFSKTEDLIGMDPSIAATPGTSWESASQRCGRQAWSWDRGCHLWVSVILWSDSSPQHSISKWGIDRLQSHSEEFPGMISPSHLISNL